jgi:hypothetical protein
MVYVSCTYPIRIMYVSCTYRVPMVYFWCTYSGDRVAMRMGRRGKGRLIRMLFRDILAFSARRISGQKNGLRNFRFRAARLGASGRLPSTADRQSALRWRCGAGRLVARLPLAVGLRWRCPDPWIPGQHRGRRRSLRSRLAGRRSSGCRPGQISLASRGQARPGSGE